MAAAFVPDWAVDLPKLSFEYPRMPRRLFHNTVDAIHGEARGRGQLKQAMCEYAWTSFKGMNAKRWEGAPQGTQAWPRFHPTQKPIGLYRFLLHHFAKPGDRILDPFLGSGSSRIAAWEEGYDFVGIEKDEAYFKLQEKRFEEWTKQGVLDFTQGGIE